MPTLTDEQRAQIHALLRETRSPTETRKRLPEEWRPCKSWLNREANRLGVKLRKPGRKLGQKGGGKRWTPVRGEVRRLLAEGLRVRQVAVAVQRSETRVRQYKKELATETENKQAK